MAKKKKKTGKQPKTKSTNAKNKASKGGRNSSAKSARKSSSKKPPAARSNSVDSILKMFQKERTAQEVQLTTMRKKIEDLEAKTRSFREQIGKLTEQENGLKKSISQLDAQRDQEVSNLLAKLGVQLRAGNSMDSAHASDNKPAIQSSVDGMRNQAD